MATLSKNERRVPLLRKNNTLHSTTRLQRCQGRPEASDAPVWAGLELLQPHSLPVSTHICKTVEVESAR